MSSTLQRRPCNGLIGLQWPPAYRKLAEEIGQKYGKSAAQVALRWILQTGATFTTQSKNKDHLKEDLQIFDFSLADEEVLQLSDMSTSLAGRLSAVADVAVPVGGAVGGALLISAVLDSLDAKSDAKPTGSAVKKATLPEPEKQQKKKKSEDEDEDEDDGAL
ncbi:GALUR [Symbiodinium microadriaticum]|nr:GALUR [Symbiodinium microadriaticum]